MLLPGPVDAMKSTAVCVISNAGVEGNVTCDANLMDVYQNAAGDMTSLGLLNVIAYPANKPPLYFSGIALRFIFIEKFIVSNFRYLTLDQ